MLIGIEGGLGDGKTLMLTRYLKKDSENGKKIYSNYHLKKIKYNHLDIPELLEYAKEGKQLNNITVGIDEITVFVDCRTSSSKRNRIFSYFVLQSRKRNCDIYYTSQDLSMLDFRLTNHTHINILCEKIYNKNDKEIDDYRKYTILDFRNPRKIKKNSFIMYIKPYYKFYDTNEIIAPMI